MNEFILKMFPQGQRKLVVSLIALAIALGLEKFGGGLTESMQTSLIAIVAIFSGGNVLEHFANALSVVRGTKVGQVIEDIIPGDQGLGMPPPEKEEVSSADVLAYAQSVDRATAQRFQQIEEKLAVTTDNIGKLINLVNGMKAAPKQGPL